ncbi:uncharacterized protein LOC105697651 isoform X2 [Orussus abietinus]|uniref:uncharacterized protein LOC105697651 isoform X2 n=1 Tax=Orussus abietinus TaxID=222816 RepID=UPI00062689E5|nr:uncharacterized protein LOC105697651 isoform X2 [Orussus abietinus]
MSRTTPLLKPRKSRNVSALMSGNQSIESSLQSASSDNQFEQHRDIENAITKTCSKQVTSDKYEKCTLPSVDNTVDPADSKKGNLTQNLTSQIENAQVMTESCTASDDFPLSDGSGNFALKESLGVNLVDQIPKNESSVPYKRNSNETSKLLKHDDNEESIEDVQKLVKTPNLSAEDESNIRLIKQADSSAVEELERHLDKIHSKPISELSSNVTEEKTNELTKKYDIEQLQLNVCSPVVRLERIDVFQQMNKKTSSPSDNSKIKPLKEQMNEPVSKTLMSINSNALNSVQPLSLIESGLSGEVSESLTSGEVCKPSHNLCSQGNLSLVPVSEKATSIFPNILTAEIKNTCDSSNWKADCVACKEIFMDRLELHKHATLSHPDTQILFCDVCGETFLHKKVLQEHKKVVHDVGNPEEEEILTKQEQIEGLLKKQKRIMTPSIIPTLDTCTDLLMDAEPIPVSSLNSSNVTNNLRSTTFSMDRHCEGIKTVKHTSSLSSVKMTNLASKLTNKLQQSKSNPSKVQMHRNVSRKRPVLSNKNLFHEKYPLRLKPKFKVSDIKSIKPEVKAEEASQPKPEPEVRRKRGRPRKIRPEDNTQTKQPESNIQLKEPDVKLESVSKVDDIEVDNNLSDLAIIASTSVASSFSATGFMRLKRIKRLVVPLTRIDDLYNASLSKEEGNVVHKETKDKLQKSKDDAPNIEAMENSTGIGDVEASEIVTSKEKAITRLENLTTKSVKQDKVKKLTRFAARKVILESTENKINKAGPSGKQRGSKDDTNNELGEATPNEGPEETGPGFKENLQNVTKPAENLDPGQKAKSARKPSLQSKPKSDSKVDLQSAVGVEEKCAEKSETQESHSQELPKMEQHKVKKPNSPSLNPKENSDSPKTLEGKLDSQRTKKSEQRSNSTITSKSGENSNLSSSEVASKTIQQGECNDEVIELTLEKGQVSNPDIKNSMKSARKRRFKLSDFRYDGPSTAKVVAKHLVPTTDTTKSIVQNLKEGTSPKTADEAENSGSNPIKLCCFQAIAPAGGNAGAAKTKQTAQKTSYSKSLCDLCRAMEYLKKTIPCPFTSGIQRAGRSVKCPLCNLHFISLYFLEMHIENMHSGICTCKPKHVEQYPSKPAPKKNFALGKEFPFVCRYCPRKFDFMVEFNRHIVLEHNDTVNLAINPRLNPLNDEVKRPASPDTKNPAKRSKTLAEALDPSEVPRIQKAGESADTPLKCYRKGSTKLLKSTSSKVKSSKEDNSLSCANTGNSDVDLYDKVCGICNIRFMRLKDYEDHVNSEHDDKTLPFPTNFCTFDNLSSSDGPEKMAKLLDARDASKFFERPGDLVGSIVGIQDSVLRLQSLKTNSKDGVGLEVTPLKVGKVVSALSKGSEGLYATASLQGASIAKSVHKVYSCSVCKDVFLDAKTLSKHQSDAHPADNSFVCDICLKDCKQQSAFLVHKFKHREPRLPPVTSLASTGDTLHLSEKKDDFPKQESPPKPKMLPCVETSPRKEKEDSGKKLSPTKKNDPSTSPQVNEAASKNSKESVKNEAEGSKKPKASSASSENDSGISQDNLADLDCGVRINKEEPNESAQQVVSQELNLIKEETASIKEEKVDKKEKKTMECAVVRKPNSRPRAEPEKKPQPDVLKRKIEEIMKSEPDKKSKLEDDLERLIAELTGEIDDTENSNDGSISEKKSDVDNEVDAKTFSKETSKDKDVPCNMCDKSCLSEKDLNEHKFFIHDENMEESELSDLLTSNSDSKTNEMPREKRMKTEKVESKEKTKSATVESKEKMKSATVEPKEKTKSATVESKEKMKNATVEPKEKTKSATVESKEKMKSATVEPKEKTKSATVESKEKTKSATVESKEKTKSATVESKEKTKSATVESKKMKNAMAEPKKKTKSATVEAKREARADVASPVSSEKGTAREMEFIITHEKGPSKVLSVEEQEAMLEEFAEMSSKKVWHCRRCSQTFKNLLCFARHMFYVHKDDSLIHECENCKKLLTTTAMVNVHICCKVDDYMCGPCNQIFSTGSELRIHNTEKHYEVPGPHVCDICRRNFMTIWMLHKHKCIKHWSQLCATIPAMAKLEPMGDLSTDIKMNALFSRIPSPFGKYSTKMKSLLSYIALKETEKPKLLDESRRQYSSPYTSRIIPVDPGKLPRVTSNIKISSDAEKKQCPGNPYPEECNLNCPLCNQICLTRAGLKIHLSRRHHTSAELCMFCNTLIISAAMNRHILDHIRDDNKPDKDDDSIDEELSVEECTEQILKRLGRPYLRALCQYQLLNTSNRKEVISCPGCTKKFGNCHYFRVHFLWTHDDLCVLCRKQFEIVNKAVEHKAVAHGSLGNYLWAAEKIIRILIRSGKCGENLKEFVAMLDQVEPENQPGTEAEQPQQEEAVAEEIAIACPASRNSTEKDRKGCKTDCQPADAFKADDNTLQRDQVAEIFGSSDDDADDSAFLYMPEEFTSKNSPRKGEEQLQEAGESSIQEGADVLENPEEDNAMEDDSQLVLIVTDEDLARFKGDDRGLAEHIHLSCPVLSVEDIMGMLVEYRKDPDTALRTET